MAVNLDIAINVSINTDSVIETVALPLDLIGPTGDMPAVSMRKIRAAYTGPCLRVQRQSDAAEQDIGFDANGWRDDTALAAFCAGTEGFIVRWYTQDAGTGSDLVQTNTSRCPRVYFNATGVVVDPTTSNPSAGFSLNTPNPQWMESAAAVPDGKDKALMAVCGTSSPTSERHTIWGNDDSTAQYHILLARRFDEYLELADSAQGNARTADDTFLQDTIYSIGYSGPSTGLLMAINGSTSTWQTAPTDTSWGTGAKLLLGADNWGLTAPMEGYISEFISIDGVTDNGLASIVTAEQKNAYGF